MWYASNTLGDKELAKKLARSARRRGMYATRSFDTCWIEVLDENKLSDLRKFTNKYNVDLEHSTRPSFLG